MSILMYDLYDKPKCTADQDARFERDIKEDIQQGLEAIFELKALLNTLHPIARDIVVRILQ